MSATIYTPYTYLIGWSERNLFYYGVRYAQGCNPSDLWNTYFTSSKYVNEFIKSAGDPDVIQIRKEFACRDKAAAWEKKVLTRLNARDSLKFLNRTNANGDSTKCGKPLTAFGKYYNTIREFICAHNIKLHVYNQLRDQDLLNEESFDIAMSKRVIKPNGGRFKKGSKLTEKGLAAISKGRKAYWDEWHKHNTKKVQVYVRKGPPEVANTSKLNAQIKSCPHCDKTGNPGVMAQWHGDNCKQNINRINNNIRCPHCPKEGAKANMKRYHFDNCKHK